MVKSIDDLKIYQLSMEIGETVWSSVAQWPYFEKDTLGKQIVRSADSLALNIAEGHGRFLYKEFRNFCFIARGSLVETKTALKKARNRCLISEKCEVELINQMETLHKMLNAFIKTIGPKND